MAGGQRWRCDACGREVLPETGWQSVQQMNGNPLRVCGICLLEAQLTRSDFAAWEQELRPGSPEPI